MDTIVNVIVPSIGFVATAFCAYKAHNAGKVVKDTVQLIEDLKGDSKYEATTSSDK